MSYDGIPERTSSASAARSLTVLLELSSSASSLGMPPACATSSCPGVYPCKRVTICQTGLGHHESVNHAVRPAEWSSTASNVLRVMVNNKPRIAVACKRLSQSFSATAAAGFWEAESGMSKES